MMSVCWAADWNLHAIYLYDQQNRVDLVVQHA